ncbi:unnamed protein product [Parnassius mnemosyne]|uniref:Uncharacterized protein n=1 Tax=Parnassius mnemosyne TaxID=213953 RepID=A0AAV1KIF5_9NEOP
MEALGRGDQTAEGLGGKGKKPADDAGGIEEHRLLHLSLERSVTKSQSPQMIREADWDEPVRRDDQRNNFGRQTTPHVGHLVRQVQIFCLLICFGFHEVLVIRNGNIDQKYL